MTDTRRGGGEQRVAGAQRRTGTRLKVEGDVVMEDTDENPKWRAQDQRRGRGEMGRQSTGAQASAEEATGQWDGRRIVGTASSVGQNGQQRGSSIGMWYSGGAEREVVTGENGRRRLGAALCPSGAARRQGSDLQLSALQEGAALKTLSLRASCSERVDHARPWWPGSTMQMQRREFGKRLRRTGGTGPQSRPQIHPPTPPPHTGRPAARMG